MQAARAIARGSVYIESRQSRNGGFCFYKGIYIDEPNLHDTYHAVAARCIIGADVEHADALARFVAHFPLGGSTHYYYYAFTLDLLGRSALIDSERLARIAALPVAVPPAGRRVATNSWLAAVLRTARLKRRFAELRDFPEFVRFIGTLKADGGYGKKANLLDTYLCISIVALLDKLPGAADLRRFVERLQVPTFGFRLTGDSLVTNLDVLHAGVKCCSMLGLPLKYPADALAFALACQTSNGGFSRVPDALPDIEMTRRALQIVASIAPDALPRRTPVKPVNRIAAPE